MSGVAIPQPSSILGEFILGQSILGGELGTDWTNTLMSEYANSPVLLALLKSFSDANDVSVDINNFYDWVWNVETAIGWGLDVWGRIVGLTGRTLTVTGEYWGFSEAGDLSAQPWGSAPYYLSADTSNFTLLDDAFRQLIYVKALANIWDGSTAGLNQILRTLFPGRGNAYVVDNLDLTMTVVFDFALTPVEVSIMTLSGVFPHPAGVAVSYTEV